MQSIYGTDRIGNIRYDNTCIMFGERVFILGADKSNHVDKIRGSSIKYCYGDEVTTWKADVFDMLKSRLDKPYSTFDGTCNPDSPSHWFKHFLDSNADIYQQSYIIDDNPYLPKDFVENLKREYEGTVYYDRYILGKWSLAEGMVYPMYNEAVGELPKNKNGDIVNFQEYCLSIDYGTLNAFAGLLWGKYNNVWYLLKEYYYSGRDTGVQKTDEEYANELDKFVGELTGLKTIIDPSAASFITLLRKRNGKYRVMKADNAVLDGIRETANCMRNGKIVINSSCKNTIAELQGYRWDDESQDDKPIKENDHACDAMRYFVKTMRVANVLVNYNPIFSL